MFNNVRFKGNGADNFVRLRDAEDMAFKDLEPVHIYEVLLRCLAVNFTGSLKELLLRFPLLREIFSR